MADKKALEQGLELAPKFNDEGLITAIAQDANTREILMVAYMNRESLDMTIRTGYATYFSRSRQKLWIKGETSGNIQEVREVYIDCDADCLLFKVEPKGLGAACHKGYRSCFYRKVAIPGGTFTTVGERMFDPEDVYKK